MRAAQGTRTMRLVFMGPPGAGKGTQGERLSEYLGVPRWSTGEMLREARGAGTELGRRAQRYMDAGELVPDVVVLGLVAEALDRQQGPAGFILDGFPRTISQAEGLAEMLRERGTPLDAVVFLNPPEKELIRRLSGRSGSEDRTDDDPETVRRRIQVYHAETAPVVDWYERMGVSVVEVDAVGTVEEIQDAVRRRLGQ